MLFIMLANLWVPKKVTVLSDIVLCILELLLLVIFKSREWTKVVVWISKHEIQAIWLLSSPDHLDGIVPLQDCIKMNFVEMDLSVNAEAGNGLDWGVLFLHGRGFPFEQPYRDWLCRFFSLRTAVRKGYLSGVKCPNRHPLEQARQRKSVNVLPFHLHGALLI
jgi:hypothetical protein